MATRIVAAGGQDLDDDTAAGQMFGEIREVLPGRRDVGRVVLVNEAEHEPACVAMRRPRDGPPRVAWAIHS